MARDFEDIHDVDDLSDDELRELVREHLAAHNGIDVDDVTISVDGGHIIVAGRVGTDEERQVADHVITDVLGLEDYENNIFVDPVRRAESPEAADEHVVDEDLREGLLLGDRALPLSPEAEEVTEDVDALLYGTTDVGHAISEGTAWIPPESPTPEGFRGEAESEELGEER